MVLLPVALLKKFLILYASATYTLTYDCIYLNLDTDTVSTLRYVNYFFNNLHLIPARNSGKAVANDTNNVE